ncbi:SLOG family protein, partial [Bacillus mobilis]
WKEDNREYYEYILSQADHIDSITKRKYESPEQFKLKNQFFIEKSDALLAVYDEEKPGSPKYIVEAAKKKGEIENYHSYFILFSDLQDIIEEEQWNNAE